MPGPGVKTEILKSKFDMIWTLIRLMFENQVKYKGSEENAAIAHFLCAQGI